MDIPSFRSVVARKSKKSTTPRESAETATHALLNESDNSAGVAFAFDHTSKPSVTLSSYDPRHTQPSEACFEADEGGHAHISPPDFRRGHVNEFKEQRSTGSDRLSRYNSDSASTKPKGFFLDGSRAGARDTSPRTNKKFSACTGIDDSLYRPSVAVAREEELVTSPCSGKTENVGKSLLSSKTLTQGDEPFELVSFRNGFAHFIVLTLTHGLYFALLVVIQAQFDQHGKSALPMMLIPCLGSTLSFFISLLLYGWAWTSNYKVWMDAVIWAAAVVLEMFLFGIVASSSAAEQSFENAFRVLLFALSIRYLLCIAIFSDTLRNRFLLLAAFLLGLMLMLDRGHSVNMNPKFGQWIWLFTILLSVTSLAPIRPSLEFHTFSQLIITVATAVALPFFDDWSNFEHMREPLPWILLGSALVAFSCRQVAFSSMLGCEPRLTVRLAPHVLGPALVAPVVWFLEAQDSGSSAWTSRASFYLHILLLGSIVSVHALLRQTKKNGN